jgi:hypothetical protein
MNAAMIATRQKLRLNGLNIALEGRRLRLSDLFLRLKGVAFRKGTNFRLHKKFIRLMDDVAEDREKELCLIEKIEAMEKRHKKLKQHNLLRRIAREAERRQKRLLEKIRIDFEEYLDEKHHPRPRRKNSLLDILILLYAFSQSSKPKEQKPG